ncbi:hypothetical protein SK128_024097, partial [Halocaridina rubra]
VRNTSTIQDPTMQPVTSHTVENEENPTRQFTSSMSEASSPNMTNNTLPRQGFEMVPKRYLMKCYLPSYYEGNNREARILGNFHRPSFNSVYASCQDLPSLSRQSERVSMPSSMSVSQKWGNEDAKKDLSRPGNALRPAFRTGNDTCQQLLTDSVSPTKLNNSLEIRRPTSNTENTGHSSNTCRAPEGAEVRLPPKQDMQKFHQQRDPRSNLCMTDENKTGDIHMIRTSISNSNQDEVSNSEVIAFCKINDIEPTQSVLDFFGQIRN